MMERQASAHHADPELYCRVNVTQNSRGVTAEKTVSVKGNISLEELTVLLGELSGIADRQIEEEKRKLENS